MSWLENIFRPGIRALYKREVPDNLWIKCPACEAALFHRDLAANDRVCTECGHHLRLSSKDRLALLLDEGFTTIELPKVNVDPLKFKDRKKYTDRLREAQTKTGLNDAIQVAHGTINGTAAVVAAFEFSFMGGSMGTAVGEAIVSAARLAVLQQAALIVVPASGGARMQEGILSLMQMPRTIIAVEEVKEAGLPYIVLLSDPTTGGVTASFAMLGDIHVSEPSAQIGFAGKRVIEETIREKLPDGFQTAEYLVEKGVVDRVIHRHEMKTELGRIIDLLMNKQRLPNSFKALPAPDGETESTENTSDKGDTTEDTGTEDKSGGQASSEAAAQADNSSTGGPRSEAA
ncbi:MAG: acetyl-CoA carboxylase, carboxyltransferase subunit beta [Alphaproteobacteria bacterium]